MASLYASLGKIYDRRIESRKWETFQQEYELAIEYFKKAIALQQESDMELELSSSLNYLALLYHFQGRYSEAEPLYLQAVEIDRRSLPQNHPSLATDLNNLALLYESQGRYSEAEPLYLQAVDFFCSKLPENHPSVLTVWENYVGLWREGISKGDLTFEQLQEHPFGEQLLPEI